MKLPYHTALASLGLEQKLNNITFSFAIMENKSFVCGRKSLSVLQVENWRMTLKMNIRLILIQLLLIATCNAFAQNVGKKYTHQLAAAELEEIQVQLTRGETLELNPELFEYIYLNSKTFPSIPNDAGIEERMQALSIAFNQLTFILNALTIESRDSVSVEHAMIMAIMGYQSAKLVLLSNEFLETLEKSDPVYNTRLRGYNRAVAGIQSFLLGYVSVTFLENEYEGVDHILTSSVIVFAPEIIEVLPKNLKKSTIKEIKKYAGSKKEIRLKKEFDELLDVI